MNHFHPADRDRAPLRLRGLLLAAAAAVGFTVVFFAPLSACAAEEIFQYSFSVATKKGDQPAFLWIPPAAERIRGVLVAGMTLAERELVQDARVRAVCRDEQLAILFLKTGLSSVDLSAVLQQAADVSAYGEVRRAPLFFVGHSAGGPQAKEQAARFRERCFGLMQYRGGSPVMGDEHLPAGIPALMMIGQFDEFGNPMRDENGRENWERARDSLAQFRAAGENNLGSIVVEPGAGHFAWSEKNAEYFALFLRTAAQLRIPAAAADDENEPVRCREVNAASGWLTDLTLKNAGVHPPAPAAEFRGDKQFASWHASRELAQATVAYHRDGFGKQDQFLRWNDAYTVDAGVRYYFTDVRWIGAGQTFAVHPAFADVVPKTQRDGKGPRWPLAGQPALNSGRPIQLRVVGGPGIVAEDQPHAIRVRYSALAPAHEPGRIVFLATAPGDAEFRATELVGMLPKSFAGVTEGAEQTLSFPPLPDLRVGDPPVELRASSSSGRPVEFYVAHGPARIVAGRLEIVEVPRRALWPLEVKVVAYQFGSGTEPRVRSAAPVERTVRLLPSPLK